MHARHPDLATRPVDVRVKMRGQTIIRARLRSTDMVEHYIEMPTGKEFAMLEFFVDRTFAVRAGARPLGVAVQDWEFVDEAPPGSWIYRLPTAVPPPRNP
jgi:hypothetical protein